MKRKVFSVVLISFVLVLGLTVFGCGGGGGGGGGSNSPSGVYKQAMSAMEKGDVKKYISFFEPEAAEFMTALMEEYGDGIDSQETKDAAKEEFAKTGGIDKIEEEIDEDGENAVLTVTHKDGSTEKVKMVKLDGKWKLSMAK